MWAPDQTTQNPQAMAAGFRDRFCDLMLDKSSLLAADKVPPHRRATTLQRHETALPVRHLPVHCCMAACVHVSSRIDEIVEQKTRCAALL